MRGMIEAVAVMGLAAGMVAPLTAAELDLSGLRDAKDFLSPLHHDDSGFIPKKGHHYILKDPASEPVYCVYGGKIICVEYSLRAEQFDKGESIKGLPGIAGLTPVDHIDIDFEQHGHGPVPGPLYTLRIYFVSAETLEALTAAGEP